MSSTAETVPDTETTTAEASPRAGVGEGIVGSIVASIRRTWTIFLRELAAFFLSPVAYVVLFLFVASNGIFFYVQCLKWDGAAQQISLVVSSMFQFAFIWILPLSPLLTMKLFAEEKRTGTIEMLMTAPVTSWNVVLGKFFAAQLFYTLIWSTLLLFVFVLEVLGKPEGPDWGQVISMFLGIFFLGTLTNSLGLLASSFSRNQLVASVLALTGNLVLFAMTVGAWYFMDVPEILRIFEYVSFQSHFSSDYFRGVIQIRFFVFYLSFAGFFLFLSMSLVEARKWR